eukprot:snap_masked-scaffold_47-processed-gene-0.4-mRNA-1 protein AED:1.00 eAED:1.00 QI:0/-1/0/0/-1/1/1/0/257
MLFNEKNIEKNNKNTGLIHATISGTVFWGGLSTFQHFVGRGLRIDSGTKILSSSVGFVSLVLSSYLASSVSYQNPFIIKDFYSFANSTPELERLDPQFFTTIFLFYSFGGTARNILASNLKKTGSFSSSIYSNHSIPASYSYATPKQVNQVQKIGKRFGCHTCGKRFQIKNLKSYKKVFSSFIADHQPPKKIGGENGKYKFYAHCNKCSSLQGGLISSLSKKKISSKFLIYHGKRFRVYKLSGLFSSCLYTFAFENR